MTQALTATLKPARGLIVRDPDTRMPLADAGETKPLTTYWSRRLVDGDVQLVVPDKPASSAPSKPA